jgi:hypothetical protein
MLSAAAATARGVARTSAPLILAFQVMLGDQAAAAGLAIVTLTSMRLNSARRKPVPGGTPNGLTPA